MEKKKNGNAVGSGGQSGRLSRRLNSPSLVESVCRDAPLRHGVVFFFFSFFLFFFFLFFFFCLKRVKGLERETETSTVKAQANGSSLDNAMAVKLAGRTRRRWPGNELQPKKKMARVESLPAASSSSQWSVVVLTSNLGEGGRRRARGTSWRCGGVVGRLGAANG